MSMKSLSAPRRVYIRAGKPLLCLAGLYFGKSVGASQIDPSKTVRTEMLPRSHGKGRIQVTQGETVETWNEQHIVFGSR